MNMAKPSAQTTESMRAMSPLNKGLGSMDAPMSVEEIRTKKWNLLADDLSLPAAILDQERLHHNLRWMQQFIGAYGASLAPHGKTTMAPKLFAMQLQAGAWGITLATAHQTRVAYAHGVRRVLMANQLVGRQNMDIIASLLRDPEFDFYCLVDSAEHLNQLGRFFQAKGLKLQVLLEVGMDDGRAGVRNAAQLEAILAELPRWKDSLVLCGVEVYEGVSHDEAVVRAFLQRALNWAREIAAQGAIARSPMILSGAGSSWFDVVAEIFSAADLGCPTQVVLRPGCYLTHDVGAYKRALERIVANNPVARSMNTTLQPALRIWAYVQSIPESTKAIVGMGRRDAAFDSGLPTPALYVPQECDRPLPVPAHWQLTRIMDQHAYLEIAAGDSIRVGDKIAFDISHPCLTFDKWRYLPVVDANYTVVDVVETFF